MRAPDPTPRRFSAGLTAAAAAAAAAILLTALFYFWTVRSSGATLDFRGSKADYYNLLVQGFRKGHTYLNVEPAPALLALPEKERPGSAPFLLDASLYHSHYYLYFGVVPAVLAYWPYAALTGQDLPEAAAVLLFALLGFAVAALWWLEIRRRYFPGLGPVLTGGSILALGFGSAVPSALRRPMFYEAAICSGYAFAMLTLWSVTRARFAARGRIAWFAAAGVAAGLAIGSRANLGPACLLLIVLGAVGPAAVPPPGGRRRRLAAAATALAAAGLGAGAIGVGLASYNFARFGNPLDFGHAYQLGINARRLFHFANLRHNLEVYYLHFPALNAYFPFVAPAPEAVRPFDYVGREQAHGEWIWLPLILAAAAAARWAWRRNQGGAAREMAWILALPGTLALVNFLVTASTGMRANRYLLDFHPALVLAVLAALGPALAARPSRLARAAGIAAGAAFLAVIVDNALASLQAEGFFAATDPGAYRAIARVANPPVWALVGRMGVPVGDREADLRWPAGLAADARQPIFSAGTPGFADVLWIEFQGARARFVYGHGEVGDMPGAWFPIVPGGPARVRISGGFLLPPAGHPWYGALPEATAAALKRTLRVAVDGVVRFERDGPSFDSSPRLQRWGRWRDANGRSYRFTGYFDRVSVLRVDDSAARQEAARRGPVGLRLQLPLDRAGWCEPLLQWGAGASAGTLGVRYVGPDAVRLVHDQAGAGARESADLPAQYLVPQRVEIDLPFANDGVDWTAGGPLIPAGPSDRLRVRWNGAPVVFPSDSPVPAADPASLVVGANLLHSGVCRDTFAGVVIEEPREDPLGLAAAGTRRFLPRWSELLRDDRGILARFEGPAAADRAVLWWRRDAFGFAEVGWTDRDRRLWSNRSLSPHLGAILDLRISPARPGGSAWLEADAGGKVLFAGSVRPLRRDATALWAAETAGVEPPGGASPSASAKSPGAAPSPPNREPPLPALPGKVSIEFLIPTGARITSSPLLTAGRPRAADSVYLRRGADGLYVLGLDHWGQGAAESKPFPIAPETVHEITLELGSLSPDGRIPPDTVRLTVDGRPVLTRSWPLYPVRPDEVFFARNPLGMSTSVPAFEATLLSIRTFPDCPLSASRRAGVP